MLILDIYKGKVGFHIKLKEKTKAKLILIFTEQIADYYTDMHNNSTDINFNDRSTYSRNKRFVVQNVLL